MPGVGVSCRGAAGATGRRAALWRRAWCFPLSGGGVTDGEDGFGGARGGVAAGAGAECGAGRCLAGAAPVPVDDDGASVNSVQSLSNSDTPRTSQSTRKLSGTENSPPTVAAP